jgi:FkbM family methyltransferase
VYDIGAADGTWTRMARGIWPDARYVLFEPLAERRPPLQALAAEHAGRVTLQPYGVGDVDAELSFGITESLWDSSFAYPGAAQRMVSVRRLDTLLARGEVPRPSFVKIDVQGFEKRVMDGGRETLREVDFVLMECTFFAFCEEMRTLDRTVAFMAERGLVPYEFVDFLRRPLDGAMGQCDILFGRTSHPLLRDRRWKGE